MTHFQIITPWKRIAENGYAENRPSVLDDYTLHKMIDVTGQPSSNIPASPNSFVVECWADDAVFAQIEADNNYLVLWSEVV